MTPKKSALAEGYIEDLSKGKMLRFEDSLPKLPVPGLQETAKRYLKSLHPLLSQSEYNKSKAVIEKFTQAGGQGEVLQQRLVARSKDAKVKNWMIDWWNEAAYLGYRDPVVPYVSYFYSHRDDRKRRDPAKRAAAITSAVLHFKTQVDNATLEPEYMRNKPIAMSSYQYMFNCCRIPAMPADYAKKHDAKQHKYILVIRHNQFFKLVTEVDGQQLNTSELEQQFGKIYQQARKCPAIGLLTSQQRDIWTRARDRLIELSTMNRASLAALEACSFVVCLDDASPVTLEERAHQYWHGDGQNRWFDKPLQFVINDNGTSGFVGEHSMMDGTPTHRLNDHVNHLIFTNALDFDDPTIRPTLADPEPLQWEINKEIENEIDAAHKQFNSQLAAHDLRVQAYQGYGKGLIKKFKCSPDAYVQMVIQLAYRKMYGTNRPTYESAATRKFQQGRTETTRSVSDESVAFCNAMENSTIPAEECISLFRAALDAHVKYISDASDARGVDRHLFGLKNCLKPGEPMPAIFSDPAYTYSSSWVISSSQLSSEYFNGYGWSQVVDNGWGLAYMINENSIQWNIVSKRLGCDRMSFYLAEAAGDVRDLMMTTLQAPKPKL